MTHEKRAGFSLWLTRFREDPFSGLLFLLAALMLGMSLVFYLFSILSA